MNTTINPFFARGMASGEAGRPARSSHPEYLAGYATGAEIRRPKTPAEREARLTAHLGYSPDEGWVSRG